MEEVSSFSSSGNWKESIEEGKGVCVLSPFLPSFLLICVHVRIHVRVRVRLCNVSLNLLLLMCLH